MLMCLINCKKVSWNTSLYPHIEQVGWKSKFNVYQNDQYIMSYQSYSYKKMLCLISTIQKLNTQQMSNVYNRNVKCAQYKSWIYTIQKLNTCQCHVMTTTTYVYHYQYLWLCRIIKIEPLWCSLWLARCLHKKN